MARICAGNGVAVVADEIHLTRNNVFSLAAFEAAYREAGGWLDDLLDLIESNAQRLNDHLDPAISVMPHEATHLAWLDFRRLGLEVPELARRLAAAGVALSPGHWFGSERAGFARMSIAAESEVIDEAVDRIDAAAATAS